MATALNRKSSQISEKSGYCRTILHQNRTVFQTDKVKVEVMDDKKKLKQ